MKELDSGLSEGPEEKKTNLKSKENYKLKFLIRLMFWGNLGFKGCEIIKDYLQLQRTVKASSFLKIESF